VSLVPHSRAVKLLAENLCFQDHSIETTERIIAISAFVFRTGSLFAPGLNVLLIRRSQSVTLAAKPLAEKMLLLESHSKMMGQTIAMSVAAKTMGSLSVL